MLKPRRRAWVEFVGRASRRRAGQARGGVGQHRRRGPQVEADDIKIGGEETTTMALLDRDYDV
jgi:hypothetical protein